MTRISIDRFDGPDLDAEDDERLARQLTRVRALMLDGHWRTLREIERETKDPQASISARLRDLRKTRFGGWTVEKRSRGTQTRGLFEYRVLRSATPKTDAPRKTRVKVPGQSDKILAAEALERLARNSVHGAVLTKVAQWLAVGAPVRTWRRVPHGSLQGDR